MKTPHDPRHRRRQILVQELFKTDFYQQKVTKEAAVILKNKELLDAEITKYAPEFPIEKIIESILPSSASPFLNYILRKKNQLMLLLMRQSNLRKNSAEKLVQILSTVSLVVF